MICRPRLRSPVAALAAAQTMHNSAMARNRIMPVYYTRTPGAFSDVLRPVADDADVAHTGHLQHQRLFHRLGDRMGQTRVADELPASRDHAGEIDQRRRWVVGHLAVEGVLENLVLLRQADEDAGGFDQF